MPDMTTIAACSTAADGLLCIAMIVCWLKDGRPRHSFWLFAPFALALPSGVLLSYPEVFGEPLGLALGWFLLTLVYAAAWQTARIARKAEPCFTPALIACLAALAFSVTLGADNHYPEWRALPRVLLMAAFSLLAAREFHRIANPHLPSAQTLAWIFLGFGLFHALRAPLTLYLPAPLGSGTAEIWSIAIFNFQIVLQGLLLGIFMTSLGRERIGMHHFHLAMVDPLTGVGNRRALERRLREIQDAAAANPESANRGILALATLDIDNFKSVNDRFGHNFGDIVIAAAANIACDAVHYRNVFRMGGEEFAVLIEAHDSAMAEAKTESIRKTFANCTHVMRDIAHRATLSAGIAIATSDSQLIELLDEADRALYLAKALGRNRTILADEATMTRLMDEALLDMIPQSVRHAPTASSEGDASADALPDTLPGKFHRRVRA